MINNLYKMIIRNATKSDAKAIADNNILLAEETEGRKIDSNMAQKGSEQVFSDKNNGFYLVADHNKEIIGQLFVTNEWSDWRNQAIWWIHRVYVKKNGGGKEFLQLFYKK